MLKLRRAPDGDVSLLSYGLLLVSMSVYLAHGIEIGDTVTVVSVPVALFPNALITVPLIRRRLRARIAAGLVWRGLGGGRRVEPGQVSRSSPTPPP